MAESMSATAVEGRGERSLPKEDVSSAGFRRLQAAPAVPLPQSRGPATCRYMGDCCVARPQDGEYPPSQPSFAAGAGTLVSAPTITLVQRYRHQPQLSAAQSAVTHTDSTWAPFPLPCLACLPLSRPIVRLSFFLTSLQPTSLPHRRPNAQAHLLLVRLLGWSRAQREHTVACRLSLLISSFFAVSLGPEAPLQFASAQLISAASRACPRCPTRRPFLLDALTTLLRPLTIDRNATRTRTPIFETDDSIHRTGALAEVPRLIVGD